MGSMMHPVRSMVTRCTALRSDRLSSHNAADYNDPNMPWDFTPENYSRIDSILAKYPPEYKCSGIMPILDLAQRQNDNWIPLAAMNKIAQILECAPMRVYEVASFYTMYNREPVGKFFIQLCGTTPCQLCGAEHIKAAIMDHLKIGDGQTTPDGLFTLLEVECLGACVNAPMIQINDDFFEDLTPATTVKLLEDLKAGNEVKIGPQSHRLSCEGPVTPKTSLMEPPPGPFCRDISHLQA